MLFGTNGFMQHFRVTACMPILQPGPTNHPTARHGIKIYHKICFRSTRIVLQYLRHLNKQKNYIEDVFDLKYYV